MYAIIREFNTHNRIEDAPFDTMSEAIDSLNESLKRINTRNAFNRVPGKLTIVEFDGEILEKEQKLIDAKHANPEIATEAYYWFYNQDLDAHWEEFERKLDAHFESMAEAMWNV